MNDFQEYNSLLPSIIGDENLKNNIAQEANAEAERKKQEITEPFNLVGSELLKSEIDKGLKSGVSKLQKGLVKQGQKVGEKVAKAVGDKVSNATGYDVSKVATKLGKGDLSGALDEGSKAVSKAVGDKVSQAKQTAQNVIDDVKGKGEDLISKGKNVLGDTEKLGKNEISNRINNLDDDLKNKVLQKLGNHSDKVVKQNLSTEDQEESMRAKAQELMNKGEKAQAKRDSGDDKPEPPKQEEEEDDDDDEMSPLEDQEGNILPPEQQAQPDQEAQDLYDRIKSNLEGDTTGEATEENQAPTSSKPSNEPDFSEDFEDQPQGLLDKMLGKQPKSKYVGTDQDPEDELQTKADQAQQKAESQALRDKYNPPPKADDEDLTPPLEENPFLFDKSLLSETNTTSAEASENFVKSLTSSKDYIPPSQQTGGQDATQLEDDAGYNRGQQKIPAKVDPKDDDDDFDETGTEENPFPPPKVEDLLETKSPLTQTESLTAEPAQPPPPAPPPAPAPPPEPAPLQQSESLTAEPASNEISQADQLAKNVSNVSDDVESGLDTAENVGSSALKATETTTQELADTTAASTVGDENPIGDIITAGIGLATLISPLFSSPHKVLPTQYLNPSSQFGA